MFSDNDIYDALETGDIEIDPIEDLEKQLQPASFDVYLGEEISVPEMPTGKHFPHSPDQMPSNKNGDVSWRWKDHALGLFEDGYRLEPGEFILGTTQEFVSISDDIAARLDGRSSVGRLGVTVHAAAGFIDPGFSGQITLEIQNTSHTPVYLFKDRRIAQIYFFWLENAARQTYDSKGGKYMNQQGPVKSRINKDTES